MYGLKITSSSGHMKLAEIAELQADKVLQTLKLPANLPPGTCLLSLTGGPGTTKILSFIKRGRNQ